MSHLTSIAPWWVWAAFIVAGLVLGVHRFFAVLRELDDELEPL